MTINLADLLTSGPEDDVQNAVQPDGGLYCLGWYLAWDVGSDTATLDGYFTAKQLRDIADHMERIKAKEAVGE